MISLGKGGLRLCGGEVQNVKESPQLRPSASPRAVSRPQAGPAVRGHVSPTGTRLDVSRWSRSCPVCEGH